MATAKKKSGKKKPAAQPTTSTPKQSGPTIANLVNAIRILKAGSLTEEQSCDVDYLLAGKDPEKERAKLASPSGNSPAVAVVTGSDG